MVREPLFKLTNLTILIFIACVQSLCAQSEHDQVKDTLNPQGNTKNPIFPHGERSDALAIRQRSFSPNHIILPTAMVAYGFISLNNDVLRDIDKGTQEEVWQDHPHRQVKIDNYLQFSPAILVYALNLSGIHGEHNFLDRSGIYIMSNIFRNITVSSIKPIAHQQRPNGSGYLSFPSGHTTEAFASAEFLRMEYRNKSPWYGVAGYLLAATTGYLRIYNNKHYLGDVIAGAGIGILSTDLSYWLYPKVKRLFAHHGMKNSIVLPYYQSKSIGLSMVYHIP